MSNMNIDEMLKTLNINFEETLRKEIETLEPDIEADPSIEVIKEILGEVSSQISYLRERVIEVKKKIQDLKLLAEAKRTTWEMEKSKIRQTIWEEYEKDRKSYITDTKKLFDEVTSGKKKLPTTVIQEMVKGFKPEKPTQSQVDDIANLKTEKQQMEILMIKRKINEYEELLGKLSNLAERYENKKFAAFGHKSIKEAELKGSGFSA